MLLYFYQFCEKYLQRIRHVSKQKLTEEHSSFEENIKWLCLLFSTYHWIMLVICTKFHVNILDSFNIIERTWHQGTVKFGVLQDEPIYNF